MELPRRILPYILYFAVVVAAFSSLVDARIHTLRLQDDQRRLVYLTTFGFMEHGYLAVKLSDMTFSKKINNSFGFTLDKSSTSESEVSSLWDDKSGECALENTNGNRLSLVVFLFKFVNSFEMQVQIIRNGDLRNLTITLEDQINPVSWPRPKRAAVNSKTITSISSADTSLGNTTSSPTPDLSVSVDVIPSKVVTIRQQDHYEIHFFVRISNENESGLYGLTFHNCFGKPVNLTIKMVENNNGSYLSVGQMPLPTMFFALSIVYFVVGSIWSCVLCSSKEGVLKIHYLMLALLYIKAISLLFHGVNYHFIEATGRQDETVTILFYIVYLMKGILMVALVVLIGAGWMFMKHVLSRREKIILGIVVGLQAVSVVASIVMSESEEGQLLYTMWKNLFVLTDLVCCVCVLFPAVWSVCHLQRISKIDGKAAVHAGKLKRFRCFYALLVIYFYFTRIIVLLLSITVPYKYEWLDELLIEVATLAFFVLTGYMFSPSGNDLYLQIPQNDNGDGIINKLWDVPDLKNSNPAGFYRICYVQMINPMEEGSMINPMEEGSLRSSFLIGS